MNKYQQFARQHLPEMLADVERLVNLDTPSGNKKLVDDAMQVVIERFRSLVGGVVETVPQTEVGNQVKLHLGRGKGQIMIITHLDTVWPEGETARRPFRNDGKRLYGPGVFDMKCALVQGLYAMHAVAQLGNPEKNIVMFVNTDEEIASKTSRALIEAEAARSDAVFVLEPPLGADGKLKTARKGVGRFTLEVEGVSAHSGIDHQSGVNALEELAHHILFLQGLTDYEKGTTVNVGVVTGGTAFNVVCPYAKAQFEVRVETMVEAERISNILMQMRPMLDRASLRITGGMVRPPMEATVSRALFADAKRIASELGFNLEETATGGASDGNFTAALNVPTLDGLGVVGSGAHGLNEYVEIDSIVPRTALLAQLLEEHSSKRQKA